MRNVKSSVVIGLGLAALTPSPSASACSGSVCAPDFFLPFEGSMPANAHGIQWWPGTREGVVSSEPLHKTQPSDLTFRCGADEASMRDIAFHVTGNDEIGLIIPDDALVVGEQCEVASNLDACEVGLFGTDGPPAYLRERASFSVTEPLDQPSILGTLTAEPATTLNATLSTSAGSCYVEVPVCGVALELSLSPSIVPWADSLLFTTYVDGERWGAQGALNVPNPTGGSFVGRGNDLVFLANESTEGAGLTQAGTHTIQIRANLVGTDTDVGLETEPLEITLDCSAPKKHDDGCTVSAHSPRSFSTLMTMCFASLLLVFRRIRSNRATSLTPRARV